LFCTSQVLSNISRSRWELAPQLLDELAEVAGRGNSVTLNTVMTGGIWVSRVISRDDHPAHPQHVLSIRFVSHEFPSDFQRIFGDPNSGVARSRIHGSGTFPVPGTTALEHFGPPELLLGMAPRSPIDLTQVAKGPRSGNTWYK